MPSPRLLLALTGVAALAVLPDTVTGQPRTIPSGAAIFIEEMDADLDGYLRAEFVKQQVPLRVVLKREDAHIVMVGTSGGNEKRSWHEGWLTSEKDHATGNITVIERGSGAMVWAGEAGDRSLWWGSMARGGQRKVASRLIKDLKKVVRASATPVAPPIPLTPEELAADQRKLPDTTQQTNVAGGVEGGTKVLTNDDILKMVEAGLAEDLIISKIKTSSPGFNIDTDALIALKKAGVSDKVIAAMMERQST